MSYHQSLIPFSWMFIGIVLLLIIIPYLRGRSDLLTAWNFFLLGSINFVGVAGLKAGYSSEEFRILKYTRQDYVYFMLGVVVFYVTLTLTYSQFKFPRRVAGRFLRKWPPSSISVLYFMLPFALLFAVASAFPPRIVGVAQIAVQVGNKAIVFAIVLAFVAWYRQWANPVLFITLLAVVLFTLVLAIKSGGGRRTFLGVIISIPICLYWLNLRYKKPLVTLAYTAAFSLLVFLLVGAYSHVRHFDRRGDFQERSVANSFRALKNIPSKLFEVDVDPLMGQNAAQTSLAAIHLYTHDMDPAPFHTLVYVLVSPIPRQLWRDKPLGLGYTLPKDCHVRGTRATWGPGIVGHGFHEGGLHMLVFYGIICATALRFWDELLTRQRGNPYILAAFSAMSGHIVGWPRGDIGTFTLQIIACFMACVALMWTGRIIFGTGVVYPRTDHLSVLRRDHFAAPRA